METTQTPALAMPSAAEVCKSLTVTRNMRGELQCQVEFPINKRFVLTVLTSKRSGGMLCTSASAAEVTDSAGFTGRTHRMFTDFHATVAKDKVRVTEKAVLAQMSLALEGILEPNGVLTQVRAAKLYAEN